MNHGHRHGDRQAQQNAHVEGLGLQRESAEAQTEWGGSWWGAERGGFRQTSYGAFTVPKLRGQPEGPSAALAKTIHVMKD